MSDLELKIHHHDGTEEVRSLGAGDFSIGRGADNWLCPVDPAMSRRHAVIRSVANRLFIADLGTRNGTHINGKRIAAEIELRASDVIEVGATRIHVTTPADSVEARRFNATLEITDETPSEEIIATSSVMTDLLSRTDRIARSDLPVLVSGETGTGKELFASRIHRMSTRRDGPFVILNCPVLASGLAESELFGVEEGVATDVHARTGRLEEADGGTLFLDEIADLGLDIQAKLLRFLQDGTIEKVGGRATRSIDVRLVAATNQDLEHLIENGGFRRDLFFRIAGVHIELPPLRERREDIPVLVEYLLQRRNLGRLRFEAEALSALQSHDFPGNVRELDAVISRTAALSDTDTITVADLAIEPVGERAANPAGWSPTGVLDAIILGRGDFWNDVHRPFIDRELSRSAVRQFVTIALDRSGGSIKELASLLNEDASYRKLVDFLRNNRLLP